MDFPANIDPEMEPMTLFEWFVDESVLHGALKGLPGLLLLAIIVVCIFVLSKGADWMIDGVVHLARRTGLPKIVIGATIVSLGTTTPEAIVSVMAAFMGNAGLALGNGVGSIIADTGLILGLTCILAAVPVNRFILSRMGWVQVGAATLLAVICVAIAAFSAGVPMLPRWVGIFFLILLAIYLYVSYLWARQGSATLLLEESQTDDRPMPAVLLCWLMIVGGLSLVIVAARILVPAASELAMRIGVPEDVVAATMVALGTSLPELTTAIASVRKGHPEITLGNVVGADILNCLFVIGAAATARPLAIPPNFFYFHFPAMLIILYSFRVFIAFNRKGHFRRWQGAWLLAVYLLYVGLQYGLSAGTD
ncbi:MAG: sodium:calcium antiporter [Desulfobacteraceae bacterium]|nr:MAG: sodium:calcium antiporter [Desulfobacteraceae bacterium]